MSEIGVEGEGDNTVRILRWGEVSAGEVWKYMYRHCNIIKEGVSLGFLEKIEIYGVT